LNDISVKLLADLDEKCYYFVRLSTVTKFDYETQLPLFKSRANLCFNGFQNDKRNVLEAAISETSDKGISLDMASLSKVIVVARNLSRKTKDELKRYETITLDQWEKEASK
jgi:hypothetical protein